MGVMKLKMNKKPQKLIFLVDDDAHILEEMSELLRLEGFSVDTSRKAIDAIDRIQGGLDYDLLVVDREMTGPDDGGDEVARVSKITNPKTPVFAMSAYHDNYNRTYFDNYFDKPDDPIALIELIKLKLEI